jgi:hypothetical protein
MVEGGEDTTALAQLRRSSGWRCVRLRLSRRRTDGAGGGEQQRHGGTGGGS